MRAGSLLKVFFSCFIKDCHSELKHKSTGHAAYRGASIRGPDIGYTLDYFLKILYNKEKNVSPLCTGIKRAWMAGISRQFVG